MCGRYATVERQYALRIHKDVDFIICGEPENVLLQITQQFNRYRSNKEELNNYLNSQSGVYFVHDGKVIETAKCHAQRNLDDFAIPNYNYLSLGSKYFDGCTMETSRSCYGNCNFCGGKVYRDQNYNGE